MMGYGNDRCMMTVQPIEPQHQSVGTWKEAAKLLADISSEKQLPQMSIYDDDNTPQYLPQTIHVDTLSSGYRWTEINEDGHARASGLIMVDDPGSD